MANKIKTILAAVALFLVLSLSLQLKVSALPCTTPGVNGCVCSSQGCDDGKIAPADSTTLKAKNSSSSSAACQNTTTSPALKSCVVQTPIVKQIQKIVNFLSAGVGIVVIIMLIVGGIQYSMAGDNPQAVSAAKSRITNALIALFAFIFTFAFLNWLIPGGIFG